MGGGRPELELERLPGRYAVCRLQPSDPLPEWIEAAEQGLLAIVRTPAELSIVCSEAVVPAGVRRSGGWAALRVAGTLEHTLTGVLASLAAPLAEAGVPIFAISSFDTDHLLVPHHQLEQAVSALAAAGFGFRSAGPGDRG